jgi:hypothetical protein
MVQVGQLLAAARSGGQNLHGSSSRRVVAAGTDLQRQSEACCGVAA